jgi:hypothetical protein
MEPATLVTTISTGRSGTTYLANLLNRSDNAVIDHEDLPRPSFVLERMNRDEDWVEYADLFAQLMSMDIAIRRTRSNWPEGIDVIGDTSHVWGKTITHPRSTLLQAYLVDLSHKVVHLVRPARACVESLLRYGAFPSLYPSGLHFAMTPDHPFASVRWPGWLRQYGADGMPTEECAAQRAPLALWYWAEIQRLGEDAAQDQDVITVMLDDLNTIEGAQRVANHCGIRLHAEQVEHVLRRHDNSSAARGTTPIRLTDDEWSQAIEVVELVEMNQVDTTILDLIERYR